MSNIEKTLSIIKPDAVERNLQDEIKQEFLRTSDGSLNVGLNVILIDSMLIEIINNTYQHIFRNIDFKLSIIAVGGYGRGELAPYSDLDLLFLIPDDLNKTETKNTEDLIKLILYLLEILNISIYIIHDMCHMIHVTSYT